jgi:glycosyltransferase involved in cell wall biosynthesis
LISIIIPCFNAEKTIDRALTSLINQTNKSFEVIAVNDGSTDRTHEILQSYKTKLNLKIINQDNQGLGISRNNAAKVATRKYLCFLDSDDYWLPNKINKILVFVKRTNDSIQLLCHNEYMLVDNKIVGAYKYGTMKNFHELLVLGNCLSPSAVMINKKLFINTGMFTVDLKLHGVEDYDLWLKISINNIKIHYMNEILGYYCLHEANMSNDPNFYKKSILLQNKYLLLVKSSNIILHNKMLSQLKIINYLEKIIRDYKTIYNPIILIKLFIKLIENINEKIIYRWLLIKFEKKLFSIFHKLKNSYRSVR